MRRDDTGMAMVTTMTTVMVKAVASMAMDQMAVSRARLRAKRKRRRRIQAVSFRDSSTGRTMMRQRRIRVRLVNGQSGPNAQALAAQHRDTGPMSTWIHRKLKRIEIYLYEI